MNILFRYMLREYVKIFGMCFAGLMTIYLVIDFFEKVRRFLRYDAHALDVLAYFVLKMPAISYQIAPLAVLMATLLTIGLLSRSHEITAMRSCGISLYWITSPFLFLGTVLAMVLFLFSSTVIPLALAKAEQIKTTRIEKRAVPVSVKAAQPWVSLGGQTLMNIDTIDPGGACCERSASIA
jgi:lipopolysaccharide export system permease protein